MPANCATPITAELALATPSGVSIEAALDFCHAGTPIWEIAFATDRGPLTLADGGATPCQAPNAPSPRSSRPTSPPNTRRSYQRFAALIARGQVEVDARPLSCIADLALVAIHVNGAALHPDELAPPACVTERFGLRWQGQARGRRIRGLDARDRPLRDALQGALGGKVLFAGRTSNWVQIGTSIFFIGVWLGALVGLAGAGFASGMAMGSHWGFNPG